MDSNSLGKHKYSMELTIPKNKIYYENDVFETTATAVIFRYLRAKNHLQS